MSFLPIRIGLFKEHDECLKVPPYTHTHTHTHTHFPSPSPWMEPPCHLINHHLQWSCHIFRDRSQEPRRNVGARGLKWSDNKKGVANTRRSLPGRELSGRVPRAGDLLILSGWCLNQKWLSKRFEPSEDGIGQPVLCRAGVFLPLPGLALLPPQEGIPGLVFTGSDCWPHSAAESLAGRDLGIWHSGGVPWMCDGFSLCQVFAAVLPSTWNTLYAQATALYPCPIRTPLLLADLQLSFRVKAGTSSQKPSLRFPKAEVGCPCLNPDHIPSTALTWSVLTSSIPVFPIFQAMVLEVGPCWFHHCMSTA